MRLTAREHPEAIKRYAHIKPARGRKAGACSATCPGTTHRCTLARGHRGPHVAHGSFQRVVAAWDSGAGGRAAPEVAAPEVAVRGGLPNKRPVGLKVARPTGVVEAVWDRLVRAFSAADEIAFILLFFVFVVLAVQVLVSIL